jgi:hypothetical protein
VGARAHRARRTRVDGGAAVVDFVMVGSLVTLMFVALLQVGFALHVRNTLISCASEGARFGARADADPAQGAQRTRELVTQSLSPRFARGVSADVVDVDGVQVVRVRVVAPLPGFGPRGPEGSLDVAGRAFLERQ